MKSRYLIFLLLLIVNLGYASSTTKPFALSATITGGTTVCQNSTQPLVTFTGIDGIAPYTFVYKINGGANISISSTGTNSAVNVGVSTSNSGVFTYTLVSISDSSDPVISQNISGNTIFNILLQPNANMGGTNGGSVFENYPVFRVCVNSTSIVNFTNTSTTTATNTNYIINWGDGTPNFIGNTWSTLSHTYQIGLWYLSYTISGSNGCTITKTFIVFVGSNPAVSLGNPGNTDICNANSLTFPITGTTNNPPGTTYTVSFNDGSLPQTFNHPPPPSVTHTFLTSSCNITSSDGSNSYVNSFSANIVAKNPCSTSSVGVVPIYVSANPQANFIAPASACINTQVCLTNTSLGNQVISNTCSSPSIIWSISPSTGFSLSGGSSLGNSFSSNDSSLWLSGSEILCLNFSVAGTYTITLKTGNKCGIDEITKIICVQGSLTPVFTINTNAGCAPLAITTTNTTVLTNQCSTPTYKWEVTHSSGFCSTTNPTFPIQTTENASYNFTEAGAYTIKFTTTNSCGSTFTTKTVQVKKPPVISINTITNICMNGTITPTASIPACVTASGIVTYAWSFPGGTPETATTQNPGSIIYTTEGNYTASLIVTNECGASNTATKTFTVNPTPTITNTDLSQAICSGASTTPIVLTSNTVGTTFSWNATATSGISGFTPSGTTATIPAQTLTSTNTNSGTVTIKIIPKIGTCLGAEFIYIITVNPAPTISTQPSSSTVCLNGVPNTLTVAINSTSGTPTYQWYSNTTNSISGGSLILGANLNSYIPPTIISGEKFYYCIISLSSAGCSSLTSNIASVKVFDLPSINIQPIATQNICVGVSISSPLSVTANGGTGTVLYQWHSNNTNATTGGTLLPGATSSTYTPSTFTAVGNYYYYVTINYSGNNCGTISSQSALINVVATPTTTQPMVSQILCQGATPTTLEVTPSGGSGSFSYQWYKNVLNNTNMGSLIPQATSPSYIPPTANVGTFYYYCIISQAALGCNVTSNTASVIISQSPSASISTLSTSVCLGGIATQLSVSTSNGIGTETYQWFSNLNNDLINGTELPGEIGSTFTPPSNVDGTLFYYCSVTFSGIVGSCNTVKTNTSKVIVTTLPVITQNPLNTQSICVGGSISDALSFLVSGGSGTVTYEWFKNSTSSNSGGTSIGNTNSSNYFPPAFTTAGNYYFYVKATFSGSGCGEITSNVAEIVVVNDPTTTQPISLQTLCENATPTILSVTPTGGIGTLYTYQWYTSPTDSNSGGTLLSGENSSTYVPLTGSVGILFYYCVISQPAPGCSVISNTAKVIVNQSPSVTIQPLSTTSCLGGNPTELSIIATNGAGTATYQWYSNTTSDTGTGMPLPGEINATFTPPATAVGILFYYCEVTFSGITGSCSTLKTNTSEVNITSAPAISQNPLVSQSICVGVSIPVALNVIHSGVAGTATYQWFRNSLNSNIGGTLINGEVLSTYLPTVFTTAGDYYFYVEISFSGSGCGTITSSIAEIIVVNDPIITAQPITLQTLCQNAIPTTLSVTASGGIGSIYYYQWYSSTTDSNSGGTLLIGQNLNTYTPLTDQIGTLFYYCVITQETASGCDVSSMTAKVVVNSAPAIDVQPQSNSYCVNQIPTSLTVGYANGTGTPNYQWYSNNLDSNSGGNLLAGQTNSSFTPSTATAENIYYYCIITFPSLTGGCKIITSNTALITVNPFPIIASENATICSNNSFVIIPLDGNGNLVPTGTTYIWSQPTVNPPGALTGFFAQAIPQTEISQTLINTSLNAATITYIVTPTSGICVGTNFNITVTVNPAINANVSVSNNACFGVNNASISTNITGGIAPYTITWTGPNGFTSSATTISNIEPGTYMLTIDDIGNCPFTNSYTITQPDDIVIITNSQTNSTCFGSNNGTIDLSITGGTGSYSYAWTKNNIAFATTQDLSNLSPGTYTATVSDENNCGPKTITFTVTEPPLLVVTLVNKTNIDCFGTSTGAINIQVVGGTIAVDYNFYWMGPNGFTSTSKNLTSLFSGTYNLTVTDDNGCQKTLQVILTQSPEIIISFTTTEITCYGANNASLTTTIVGGSAPYSFVWDNLATSLNQDNLAAGNYTITVNDNLGCIKLATVNIPEAPIFTINPVVKNVSCFGANNGSINLNLVGGIAPVSLSWSDGSTAGLTRNNLTPGTYTVTITDGKPCVIVRTFIIIQPQTLVLSANLVNPTNCNNANSGAIDLIVSGGTPPFSYSWSNGTTNEDLINTIAGSYSVTVLDKNGCSVSALYTLIRPELIKISVTTQTDFNCTTHQVKQNFVAQASGGVPPFTYQWSSGNISGNNNQIMNTDTNGIVILTVFDSLGCSQIYTVNVDNPEIGYAAFEPTSVSYTSFGFFSINDPIQFISTITGDYESLFWDFGDGTFSSELNPLHTFLIPKDYVVTQTVTYPFGCVYKHVITLTVEKGYLLVLPTGFTPNNDSLNDKYRPVAKGLKNITMDIYDSWGSIIYSEKGDVIKGWDGKIKGFDAENGNYYSKVAGETFYGTTVYESQTIVLIK